MMELKYKKDIPAPSDDDIFEVILANLKAKIANCPMLKAKVSEGKEEKCKRDDELREILANAKCEHLKADAEFILHIPEMHLSWVALKIICQHYYLLKMYANVICELYKENHTPEQEHIWLAMDSEELLEQLTAGGLIWSRGSKRLLEAQYPKLYKKYFESYDIEKYFY